MVQAVLVLRPVRVRGNIIGRARTTYVGTYQSCMIISKWPTTAPRIVGQHSNSNTAAVPALLRAALPPNAGRGSYGCRGGRAVCDITNASERLKQPREQGIALPAQVLCTDARAREETCM